MSSWGFAPIVTRLTFTASTVPTKLLNGQTCKVWGFVIANTGTSTTNVVTITSGDGSTTYYQHTYGSGETVVVDTKFIADAGLAAFVTGVNFADFNVIFFHGNVD